MSIQGKQSNIRVRNLFVHKTWGHLLPGVHQEVQFWLWHFPYNQISRLFIEKHDI